MVAVEVVRGRQIWSMFGGTAGMILLTDTSVKVRAREVSSKAKM